VLTIGKQLSETTNEKSFEGDRWKIWQLIAFRFACSYFLLYKPTVLLAFIPVNTGSLMDWYQKAWEAFVPWIGANVLHLSRAITVFPNGSGDTTFNYVQILCFLVAAGVATIIWSVFDWKRANYKRLHEWLRVFVRFCLAMPMFGYGAAKIFEGQFGSPCLTTLLEPYGNSSPMTLLWTLMGTSRPYCVFGGLAEWFGGLLLIVPRLTTLGALVCIAVMSNIFMLNLCYDVPVKLYSFHLLLMAVFLLLPDLKRLTDVLVFNREVKSVERTALTKNKWLNKSLLVAQVIFGLYFCFMSTSGNYKYSVKNQQMFANIPFHGIWQVSDFVVDGVKKPLVINESNLWRRVVFDKWDTFSIEYTDGLLLIYGRKLDQKKKILSVVSKTTSNFTYDDSYPDILVLDGVFAKRHIKATLHLVKDKFLLTNRGFHWISEYPCEK